MSDILKLGVLASGRGSNLQSILDAIDAGDLEARVNVVISNTPRCLALERASGRGIRTECISRKAAGGRQPQLLKMTETLQKEGVDMVVLAGFNLITPPEMTAAFPDRILNIHPSLLPAFAGGMAPSPQQDAIDCATQALEKYNIEKDIAAFIKKLRSKDTPRERNSLCSLVPSVIRPSDPSSRAPGSPTLREGSRT